VLHHWITDTNSNYREGYQMTAASKLIPEVKIKVCKKCLSEFEGQHCKPCRSLYMAEYRVTNKEKVAATKAAYYAANKVEIAAYWVAHREANPGKNAKRCAAYAAENRETANARAAAWYTENKERAAAYRVDYYKSNKESLNEYRAGWASVNKDILRVHRQNRRARKKLFGGKLSKGLSGKLFMLQKGKCACCKKPLGDDYHLDHITPLAKGGANEDWNMQLLTKRCNLQKQAKDPIEFMQSRGFLL
jgi:5-methylcytosine-specific restriction endonuclease McrA